MKRFYKTAEAVQIDGGYTVQLDGRTIKTPAKAELIIPTKAAADLVAEDWNEQGEMVDAQGMTHARFANTAIDRVAERRTGVIDEVAAYAGSDLVCYRAERPDALVARQAKSWDPFIAFARDQFGAELQTTAGIMHISQSDEALAKLRAPLEVMNDHEISAFFSLTTGLGSLVLALALSEEPEQFDGVFAASQLDAVYQEEEWGHDKEAADGRAALHLDLKKALAYLMAVRNR